MKLWQLINPLTNEKLSEPQELPENWGPIFGLHGVKDRLGDLSWLGISDRAWVEVDVPDPVITKEQQEAAVRSQIDHLLKESSEKVAYDNIQITKAERQAWTEYRRLLREIPNQGGFPQLVEWPSRPE